MNIVQFWQVKVVLLSSPQYGNGVKAAINQGFQGSIPG